MVKFLVFFLLCIFPVSAQAMTKVIIDRNISIRVGFTESDKNAGDSSPITDLARCAVTVDIIGDGLQGQTKSSPASAPTGGGPFSATFVFVIANPGAVSRIQAAATCTDLSGNVSIPATLDEPLTFVLPDGAAPSQVIELTVEIL